MSSFLALAAAAATLGEIAPQRLNAGQCATFLWARTEAATRIAMIDEARRELLLKVDGRELRLPALAEPGAFGSGGWRARVDLEFATRPGLERGAIVERGVLGLDAEGRDSLVVPVGGLRGCA